MKHTILCLLLALAAALPAAAQTGSVEFRIGDTVQTPGGKTGVIESWSGDVIKVKIGDEYEYVVLKDLKKVASEPKEAFRVGDAVVSSFGQPGRIEAINGNYARVRYGNGKYDFKMEELASLRSPHAAAREAEQEKMRKIFRVEAAEYLSTVRRFEQFFTPQTALEKGGVDDEVLKTGAIELERLDRLCKTKYPGITNETGRNLLINERFGDWCRIAAQRDDILQKAKTSFLGLDAEHETERWTLKISRAMKDPDGYVNDEMQMLIYDRPAWEKKNAEHIRKKYAARGETMPPEAFAALYKKADEFKAQIERDAPARGWTQPNFTDASLEALARREFPTDLPGARVLKTGMTYTTWQARDDKSYIGDGFYRITPGAYRFKLGLALVKLPNRPFCQIREFQMTQHRTGAGYGATKASIGKTGIFVKCP
ncbi:MAG TPA: hypothetical protein VK400_16340 [Pyrinomonadaceae bacterium]|nr:hypothetical protein [Pyrinomonadaceae bacterium]